MSRHWTWAGGFLALAFGGIGFGAKAGIESGQQALRLEKAHATQADGHNSHAPQQAAAHAEDTGARAQRDHGLADKKEEHTKKPHIDSKPDLPHQREAAGRVPKAPAKAKTGLAPAPVRPEAPRVEQRLFTPASELDIAFATGRLDSLDPEGETEGEKKGSTETAPKTDAVKGGEAEEGPTSSVGTESRTKLVRKVFRVEDRLVLGARPRHS